MAANSGDNIELIHHTIPIPSVMTAQSHLLFCNHILFDKAIEELTPSEFFTAHASFYPRTFPCTRHANQPNKNMSSHLPTPMKATSHPVSHPDFSRALRRLAGRSNTPGRTGHVGRTPHSLEMVPGGVFSVVRWFFRRGKGEETEERIEHSWSVILKQIHCHVLNIEVPDVLIVNSLSY